jgi:aarF domain-containing kinase
MKVSTSFVLLAVGLIATANAFVVPPARTDSAASSFSLNAATTIESTEFPPPLSRVDRLKRAAQFWSTAVPIIASYYGKSLDLKLREGLLGQKLTEEQIQEIWDEQHEIGAVKLSATVASLKGFYVKTAQIISSRGDLFPEQYTEALSCFTDNVDPMGPALAKAVITQELLNQDEKFEDVFAEFDEVPLGSASIAQVHRCVLSEKYGGREVAVKIQRPSIESKLMGDIANLKAISKPLQDADALPLDYYTVFCELEKQLADEFDFVAEAVAMDRIYNSLSRTMDGSAPTELPIVMPRPVSGLVSRRVLVMDYLPGVPLSRAREEMQKRGIDPESPEAKLFARNLLSALTKTFGRNILETGFFHADPHPGNIFVLDDGRIGLIDFGQVKQISGRNRETLAKVMIALDEREDGNLEDMERIGNLALELGVEIKENAKHEAPAAIALWLFDGSATELPGGYDMGELSPNSPVKELKSFPQDLVLAGRAAILIKGVSNRLGVPWSLSHEWAPIAADVLSQNTAPSSAANNSNNARVRFRDVGRTFSRWAKGRVSKFGQSLPAPLRSRVASIAVNIQDRKARREMQRRPKK